VVIEHSVKLCQLLLEVELGDLGVALAELVQFLRQFLNFILDRRCFLGKAVGSPVTGADVLELLLQSALAVSSPALAVSPS